MRGIKGIDLVIRADADETIGTGHVMRCLALAQEWLGNGGRVVFVGRITAEGIKKRIFEEGCELVALQHSYPDPEDLATMKELLAQKRVPPPWVTVDGYHFDTGYVAALQKAGTRVLQLDDYCHQREYRPDILLNHNPGGRRIDYSLPPTALCLRGSRYFLLRSEFVSPRQQPEPLPAPATARRILVTMGGSAPEQVFNTVLDALARAGVPEMEVVVVAGRDDEKLPARLGRTSLNCQVHGAVREMTPLMRWADMAVCAGGVTSLELAALGVPVIIVSLAENQTAVAAALDRAGAGLYCGPLDRLTVAGLAAAVRELILDGKRREEMAANGQALVDGQGAARVVKRMTSFPGGFRPVVVEDRERLFGWANDPAVRRASFQSKKIEWDEHCRWLAAIGSDNRVKFWMILTVSGDESGSVRFEMNDSVAEISITVAPRFRGLGLAGVIIRRACAWLFGEARQIERITALVKKENERSLKSFLRAGFVRQDERVVNGVAAEVLVLDRNRAE